MKIEALQQDIFSHIELTFSRSGGKGGQNVNKVNTKVTAMLPIEKLDSLTEEEKKMIQLRLKNRLTIHNELFIYVQDHRSQFKNRELAYKRILKLIINALIKEKKRIESKPSINSREKRMKLKKNRSDKKKNRSQKIDLD